MNKDSRDLNVDLITTTAQKIKLEHWTSKSPIWNLIFFNILIISIQKQMILGELKTTSDNLIRKHYIWIYDDPHVIGYSSILEE